MEDNSEQKFIPLSSEDFENKYDFIFVCSFAISALLVLLFPFIVANIGIAIYGFVFVASIITTAIVCNLKNEEQQRIEDKKFQIKKQNKSLFAAYVKNLIKKQVGENAKIICIVEKSEMCIQAGISDDTKKFVYIKSIFNANSATTKDDINICNYNDILKYELIDNSTSQLISSSSTTNSNAGKAVLGAVAGGILFGEAGAGAVVGASGKRTTQTQYETKITNKYTLNIFINKLNDSIISLTTQDRDKISEVISLLEYALNNK